MLKVFGVRRTNYILFAIYAGIFFSFSLGSYTSWPYSLIPWPLIAFLLLYAAFYLTLYFTKRPCRHISIMKGGRLGLTTLFIHRDCPICGKSIS